MYEIVVKKKTEKKTLQMRILTINIIIETDAHKEE